MDRNLQESLLKKTSRKFLTWSLMGSLALGVAGMVGCKKPKNQIVSDVNLSANLENDDVVLDLSALFNFGAISMTAVKLKIMNPEDPSVEYGEFRVLPTLDGKNEIGARVNLTEAARIPGGLATLPNGDKLPIGGLNGVEVLELRIDSIKSKVYLALGQKALMFGFAIAIKEFDQLTRYVGMVNIFPGFLIKGVKGMVGVFTGKEEGQSGLGFFLDLSTVINPELLNRILDGTKMTQEEFKSIAGMKSKSKSNLNFNKGVETSDKKAEKAYDKAQELGHKSGNSFNFVQE